ncbi:MAG: leucine-rich repeat domain-containing protein [Bernardetiaceae bacterium]|nr:leucine-rich repeat domain-containing protein [Bernardetiaceae bacterium]
MKKIILSLLSLLLLVSSLSAQSSYQEAIDMADAAFKTGSYKRALNLYFAAEAFSPQKKEEVKAKVNMVFDKIEALRKEAESSRFQAIQAQKIAERALNETEVQKQLAGENYEKATKLIDAFYFYENRFALAMSLKEGVKSFYFIDKNGDNVSKLGVWEEAEQFSSSSYFTKVWKEGKPYYLDTLGNNYKLTYDHREIYPDTRAVDLSEKKHRRIPKDVFKNSDLEVLILAGNAKTPNRLNKLPSDISKLPKLEVLHLEHNRLSALPNEIGKLENLRNLRLQNNEIKTLPPSFSDLIALEELNLSQNMLEELPYDIGKMQYLYSLNLSQNRFFSLAPSFGDLESLQYLDLSNNQIDSLPSTFFNLKKLKMLNLEKNQIARLPKGISSLSDLEVLNLSENKLQALPQNIGKMTALHTLNLCNNSDLSLDSICHAIADTDKEIHFSTDYFLKNKDESTLLVQISKPKQIPAYIAQLKKLNTLDLSNGTIRELPTEIGTLYELNTLILNRNRIKELPKDIALLKNLSQMSLDINQIKELPEEIGAMLNLQTLSINGNRIVNLPRNIGNLRNLQTLSLSYNQIRSLPEEIVRLKKLQNLDLETNQITVLPEDFHQLENLLFLHLGSNALTAFPKSLTKLKKLNYLNLNDNKIAEVPKEIVALTNLKMLDLRNNPIPSDAQLAIRKLLPNCRVLFTEIDYFRIGQEAFDAKNYEEAIEAYLKDIKYKGTPESYGNLGLCYRLLGDNEKALTYLNSYLDVKPNHIPTMEQLTVIYQELGMADKAYPITKKLTKLKPNDLSYKYDLSYFALFANKPKEAIEAADYVLANATKATDIETHLALAYVLHGDYNKAEPIYLKWKGKKLSVSDLLADEVFIKDIEALEKVGITHEDFSKVRALFE